PQQPRRRPAAPVVTAPPTRRPQPDDLICGDCGEGNPPTRRFCSRCGGSLQTATVVPTPWWRKLLRLFQRRVRPAGSRPKRRAGRGARSLRGLFVAARRMLLVALLLAGLLYMIFPQLRGAVNEQALAAKDRVGSLILPQYVPVRPTSVTATGELPDHPAGAATDGFKNTFWTAPDAAAQPTLVLGFDRPTDLVRAIVHNGGGEDFQALGRAQQLHLVYSTGQTADVTLEDTPEPQQVEFGGGDGATSVEIHVVSTYRSVQSPGLALSEIELFERE
ncbi:MAG: NADase-type glycan-binding domain-containing protein, partial [Pseudonocardiaceae bacterium]